jgi:hypothetical protein
MFEVMTAFRTERHNDWHSKVNCGKQAVTLKSPVAGEDKCNRDLSPTAPLSRGRRGPLSRRISFLQLSLSLFPHMRIAAESHNQAA